MNKSIGLQLVVYSLLLAGLSYVAYQLAPVISRPTLIAGLVGGALCLAWGVRALGGSRGKALPMLTLIPVSFILLSQTILGWTTGSRSASGLWAPAVITLLFVLSIAMLMRIAYAGVIFARQP